MRYIPLLREYLSETQNIFQFGNEAFEIKKPQSKCNEYFQKGWIINQFGKCEWQIQIQCMFGENYSISHTVYDHFTGSFITITQKFVALQCELVPESVLPCPNRMDARENFFVEMMSKI